MYDSHKLQIISGKRIAASLKNVAHKKKSQRVWMQDDGTPQHFGREVTRYLNLKYQRRWTSFMAS
jgi:hypothetical protein